MVDAIGKQITKELCERYVLKDPETGTIIELEGSNRCDIKLESEEHDGD